MVWKIKRFIPVLMLCVLLLGATCTEANASSHEVYQDGNISSTYVQYFRDIVSSTLPFQDYVAFRSSQYEYTLLVGNLFYENGIFTGKADEYVFSSTSSYNSQSELFYSKQISVDFSVENEILYSNLGHYPKLVERGANYEMFNTLLLVIFGCACIIRRIFFKR